MPELTNDRTASRRNNTTAQIHIDAARDLAASGGYDMVAATHALIALALIQQEQLELQKASITRG